MNESEQIITRYLLGELSEGEQTALEEEYFKDSELFDRIVQVENELVDKYARGLLKRQTRERMELHYLTHPKRRERANFAAAMVARIDRTKAKAIVTASWWPRLVTSMREPKLVWAYLMILLVLVAAAFWVLIESRRLHRELAEHEAGRATQEQREHELKEQLASEQQRAQQLSAALDRLRASASPTPAPPAPVNSVPSFVSFALLVGGMRGPDTGPRAMLVIPAGTQQVRIRLRLGASDYQSYRAVLQPAGGRVIFSSQRLQARASNSEVYLSLHIPADKFVSGDYILTLRGVTASGEAEDLNKSLFHVEKK